MNTTGKGFGKRLRKLRKAAGLTQAALGASIGVSGVSINQYEAGVHEPREKTAAKLMSFFEGTKVTPPDQPVPKKRGRPRKARPEVHLGPKVKHRLTKRDIEFEEGRRFPRMDVTADGRPKILDKRKRREEKAEAKDRKADGAEIAKSPARHGLVSGAWLDQQVESFVHARGHVFQDGPVRVVVMSRPDVLALCKLMLEVGAVRVE